MDIKNRFGTNEKLIIEIAKHGRKYSMKPPIQDIFPFKHYFSSEGVLLKDELIKNDGLWTRREILTRYLFLQAVLDQGPDIIGIRLMLKDIVNSLYQKEVRLFHKPLDFFKEIGISIDEILQKHKNVKDMRAAVWANENKSTPNKYNLFMDNSKQVLGYAIYRWGVPLSVPYLLEKDLQKNGKESFEPLVDYVESWNSAEMMSRQLKDNERYGLGKAIGDKAAHLFVKWYIHTFGLAKKSDESWGEISYELPLDSNAGRVLFRTGFWLMWANLEKYQEWKVIRPNEGKGGKHYIRVTDIRGRKSDIASSDNKLMNIHKTIATSYLKTHSRNPKKIEIQQIPNSILYNTGYGIGDLDDGLIYIGTNFCFNHDIPKCTECPIKSICEGYNKRKDLISDYRT